jgi:8-oxo-dGTP pyrophosphatase MutT (NUDIX family)
VEDGEIWISSPSLARGYLGDPERTAAAFVTDGSGRWYRTGDAGSLEQHERGPRLTVSGRRDDVVISGGEKVSLGLVEQAVRELPGYGGAVVLAGADERWGEVPVVVAERAALAGQDPEQALELLRRAVGASLGRAARPGQLLILDAIPLLQSGKPDRRTLARLAEEQVAQEQTHHKQGGHDQGDPARGTLPTGIATPQSTDTAPVVRVSAVLVTDERGLALLVRKAGTELFMQPGGKPEPAESALDAAVRELAEEVGVQVPPARLRSLGRFRAAAANEIGHQVVADAFALVLSAGEADASVARAEIAEAVWATPRQMAAMPLAPLTRDHLLPLLEAAAQPDDRASGE